MSNKRDELLQVATQLAAALNANPAYDYKIEIVDWATNQAKDLIEKVDGEFGEESRLNDSLLDEATKMYKMLLFLVRQDAINDHSIVNEVNALLAKARGGV